MAQPWAHECWTAGAAQKGMILTVPLAKKLVLCTIELSYIIKKHRIPWLAHYNIKNLSLAVFSDHAAHQINRRGIFPKDVHAVLANPYSIELLREGRVVVQGLVMSEVSRRPALLRIFVDVDRNPPVIVTAYKTSKLEKYGVQDECDIRFQD